VTGYDSSLDAEAANMTRVVPTTAQERDRKQAGLPVLPLPAAPSGFRVGPFYFRPTEGPKVRIRLPPAASQQRTAKRPCRLAPVGIDLIDGLAMRRGALEKNYDRLDEVLVANSRYFRPVHLKEIRARRWDREKLWGGRRGNGNFVAACNRWSAAMPQPNDLSRSLVALDQNNTIIAVR
jgi:hypothetical protein